MTKQELQLWKKYTAECRKHNLDFSMRMSKLNTDRFKKEQKAEEKKEKECAKRWKEYNKLSFWQKTFTEKPDKCYPPNYRYYAYRIQRLIDKITVGQEIGSEREITYENFLDWRVSKKL